MASDNGDGTGRLPKGAKGDRDEHGRYLPGHALPGPGNPHGQAVAQLRATLLKLVTPARLKRIVLALVGKAEAGDIAAAREILDRVLGKPVQQVVDQLTVRSAPFVMPSMEAGLTGEPDPGRDLLEEWLGPRLAAQPPAEDKFGVPESRRLTGPTPNAP